jgi:hypothetical protein
MARTSQGRGALALVGIRSCERRVFCLIRARMACWRRGKSAGCVHQSDLDHDPARGGSRSSSRWNLVAERRPRQAAWMPRHSVETRSLLVPCSAIAPCRGVGQQASAQPLHDRRDGTLSPCIFPADQGERFAPDCSDLSAAERGLVSDPPGPSIGDPAQGVDRAASCPRRSATTPLRHSHGRASRPATSTAARANPLHPSVEAVSLGRVESRLPARH